jgi:hypothetical protein
MAQPIRFYWLGVTLVTVVTFQKAAEPEPTDCQDCHGCHGNHTAPTLKPRQYGQIADSADFGKLADFLRKYRHMS